MAYDLSVLIPARNEYFGDLDLLSHTVANVLENSSDATEIIVILDGYWPLQPLAPSPRLTVVHHNTSIGQRAACNEAARLSTAKFVMKLDAHCAVDKDFDTKLMAQCKYDHTIIPVQYNLQAFNWRCKQCKHETYQGPKPDHCAKCQSRYLKIAVKWQPRGWKQRDGVWTGNPKTTSWYFDTTLHFQYDGSIAARYPPEQKLTPTMSCLGACWFLHRERYWELGGMDEKFGSWGSMGTELACKSHLSGGQMLVNHDTWFAHLFRTQSGPMGTEKNFSFPYGNPGGERARARSRELWLENQWPKQKYPLSWLVEKFKPLKDWHGVDNHPVLIQVNAAGDEFYKRQPQPMVKSDKPSVGILYYTCNTHDQTLELAARNNLLRSKNGHELGCVARERTDFGDWTIVVQRERSGTTMHYQILEGLERMRADYVFLCESDVFYSGSHFDFIPTDDSTFFYNTNVWRVRYSDGHAVRTDNLQQVSGICANRKLLLDHYRKRVELIERNGGKFDTRQMAYEPGTRGKFGDEKIDNWQSPFPNIDVTDHGQTLTKPHFSVDSFRNPKYAAGWQETDEALPGWPKLAGRMQEWLAELANG